MPANQRIIDRLTRADKGLEDFKNKIWRLRDIVAGNGEALVAKGLATDQSEHDVKRKFPTMRGDIFINRIEEGRSNKILQSLRTLVQQTTANFPEVECEDLDYEEANLHAEYFRQRLGPRPIGCDAVQHMRRALWDYLTGGFGWVWIGMQGGKPIIRWVDTLDCKWDQSAPTIGEGLWWSTTMYGTYGAWKRQFGQSALSSSKYTSLGNTPDDAPVELEFYYDLDTGPKGAWKVLLRTGTNNEYEEQPVFESPNPCSWNYGGKDVPYLPAESMFFMEIPSVRLSIGLAEQMLPDQVALWRVDATIRDIVDCPAFYEYEEGAIDAPDLLAFISGKVGRFLKRKKSSQPIIQNRALEVPPSLVEWRNLKEQGITGQGGANPYATGAPVEGTTYAAEVNAIQASSSLMAGTILKDSAAFWVRVLQKFLAKGAQYDEWPLVVRHEDVNLTFDESDPIKTYLHPEARLVVRENSMEYTDQIKQVQLAKARLDAAIEVNTATGGMYAQAVKEEYENFLRSSGEKSIDKFLPQTAPMQPTVPGAPVAPGMPPGGIAPGAQPVAPTTA